jgi:hypothetical protein
MTVRTIPPKADWKRHHPTARAIAARLLQNRDVLRLSTGLLVQDITTTHRVGASTAARAVGIARAAR